MLLSTCGNLLIPSNSIIYFLVCGYWCHIYCNLSFALDRVRLQHMSIFPLTHVRLSKSSFYQWFECSELWARFPCFVSEGAFSTKETPLFDPVIWRPHFAHAPAKTKTDYTIWGEAGGRTPADLHLPFHGFVRCPVLHRELHHCQAGLRQTSPRLDSLFPLFFPARSQPRN